MFRGRILIKDDTESSPYPATYTAPFPRGGLAALFTAEVTQLAGSPTLSIVVQTKNRNETSWLDLGSFTDITATGVYSLDVSGGIHQQVRIAAKLIGGSVGDWVDLSLDGISWRP
jgi:hypothetical protein